MRILKHVGSILNVVVREFFGFGKFADTSSSFVVVFAEGCDIGLGGAESLESLERSNSDLIEYADAILSGYSAE